MDSTTCLSSPGKSQSRFLIRAITKFTAFTAEAFVFIYFGITIIGYIHRYFSISFFLVELVIVLISRASSVFMISGFYSLLGVSNFKLSFSDKGIISFAGTIRGAIGFGLALGIESNEKSYRQVLISTTLCLVFFTTFVFGAMMPFVIRLLQGKPEENLVEMNLLNEASDDKIKVRKDRLSYWILSYWKQFDEEYLRPKMINNWGKIKEEHRYIISEIDNVLAKAKEKYSGQ